MLEAIQALPPIPTPRPLNDDATRAWLKEHGFDLNQHMMWWDEKNEAGTVCRHFRQHLEPVKNITGKKALLS